ncbi:hypothetical protein B0T21DRAFT_408614 [Apiosordaria backusii]|uniref:EKC/KEOPS complex subunit GON7 n=1 Tax=Apiosordaria backusii TaxID=314023 RepID=A0AA40K145_9PEZI|nr:hypothetical protein B0T21DRAFT_408614 [Apiosordaria backusii]
MSTTPSLSVSYTSETNAPFTVSLPQSPPTSTDALRQSALSLQDRVNKELTERMEEDNARNGAAINGTDKEEENYGEEVVEED